MSLRYIGKDFKCKSTFLYGATSTKYILRAIASDASLSMILYRLMQSFSKRRWCSFLAPIICKLNAVICGAVIGCKATFGENFIILHSVGIVINSKVRGGRNVYLESGVVIGDEKGQAPRLGNNVFIGSGAKLFGNISIGDDVKIGANAVVNKNVPSHATAVGVPAKSINN